MSARARMSLLFPKSLSFVLPQITPCRRFVAGLLKGVSSRLIRPKGKSDAQRYCRKCQEDTSATRSKLFKAEWCSPGYRKESSICNLHAARQTFILNIDNVIPAFPQRLELTVWMVPKAQSYIFRKTRKPQRRRNHSAVIVIDRTKAQDEVS